MSAKKTSGAVMTSLIVHGVVFADRRYLSRYPNPAVQRPVIGAEVLQAKEPPQTASSQTDHQAD